METSDIDPQNVGLLPQHKERLERFADRYCAAATRGARREVALLAAGDMVKEFKITGKEEIALANQVSFFYTCSCPFCTHILTEVYCILASYQLVLRPIC